MYEISHFLYLFTLIAILLLGRLFNNFNFKYFSGQVPLGANGCAYFPFEELCDRPLGAADYFGLFSKPCVSYNGSHTYTYTSCFGCNEVAG